MINRQLFTGRNEADAPILVGMELQLKEKQVELLVFPREGLPEDFVKALGETWEQGEPLDFPVEPTRIIRSAEEEHLLPIEIKADRPEIIARLQNEWTLKLLSYKLYESIGDEIASLQSSIQDLGNYSQEIWDKAKKTWDEVGNHAQDFNLSRNHATELRERVNKVFEQLKKLREGGQAEFEQASATLRTQYENTLASFQAKMKEHSRVNELFDQLKSLQKEIKEARLTHRDRRTLWNTLDESFEFIKGQKENLWQSHLGNRIKGLEEAMKKIQSSVDRDRANIDFEVRKLESGRISQLEQQLRSTRMKVMEDRIKSKEEKLADMSRTLQQLKKKESSQRKKHEAASAPQEAGQASGKSPKEPRQTPSASVSPAKETGKAEAMESAEEQEGPSSSVSSEIKSTAQDSTSDPEEASVQSKTPGSSDQIELGDQEQRGNDQAADS